jgi:3-hydroxymyristoyl/3-hydroxydecanoyl-(acyl carrier protein) dehydratase
LMVMVKISYTHISDTFESTFINRLFWGYMSFPTVYEVKPNLPETDNHFPGKWISPGNEKASQWRRRRRQQQ